MPIMIRKPALAQVGRRSFASRGRCPAHILPWFGWFHRRKRSKTWSTSFASPVPILKGFG